MSSTRADSNSPAYCWPTPIAGTNTGSFMGNAPSGMPIDVGAVALMRVASGKVTELRAEFDKMG